MSKYIKLEGIKMLINACEWRMTLAKERRGEGFVDYDKQVLDVDELTKRLTDLPTIEVSDDCISRSALISFIDAGHLRNPNEKCYSENDVVELIKNAPSVVPSRAEPEEKQRGRLERFTSAELNKILDNFCEQVGVPLPVKTKNEIVASIALEQAKTVAAERLNQAMKESEE